MSGSEQLKTDVLSWLLEAETPGVRFLAMRDLLKLENDHPELRAARAVAYTNGPIAAVLDGMDEKGFWVRPGSGYNPKYRSAVWSLTLLAQLGASIEDDDRIARACTYMLEHALTPNGQFTATGAPSGTIDCLQGNLCWSLLTLECTDPSLDKAFDWMARSVSGDGISPAGDQDAALRFYAYKCGPCFACGANNRLPCAWGAAKVMLAFSALPVERRTPQIENAIKRGVDFLFSVDPAGAKYPTRTGVKPSPDWWKFGFPVFYITDLLQIIEALSGLGFGQDQRLAGALEIVRNKQNARGRWLMEYGYAGKTWGDYGEKKKENKWVTLRALRVLSMS
jgi:hypothetical protein